METSSRKLVKYIPGEDGQTSINSFYTNKTFSIEQL